MTGPSPESRTPFDQAVAGDRPDPFFIVGTGRCGSTLLQAILARHPRVAIPSETQFFDHLDFGRLGLPDPLPIDLVPGYLDKISQTVAVQFLATDDRVIEDMTARLMNPPDGSATHARDLFLWLLERMTAHMDRDHPGVILGEKTPQHWKRLDRILELFPRARVIHIYRDPRDVTASLLAMDWWTQDSTWRTARYWNKTLRGAREWQRRLGDRHLTLRFESILENPERQIREVCGFLGLEFDERMIHPQADDRTPHVAAETAYKRDASGAVDKSKAGQFESKLSPAQIRAVEVRAGAGLMRRLGYTPRYSWPARMMTSLQITGSQVAQSLSPSGGSSRD